MPIEKDWQGVDYLKRAVKVGFKKQAVKVNSKSGWPLLLLFLAFSLYFMVKPPHPTKVTAWFSGGEWIPREREVMR